MIYCVNIYCVLSIYIYSDLIEIFGSDRFMKGKLTAIVLTAVIIGVLFLSRTGEIRAAGTETENNALFDGLKIVLDAGHGGIDGGVEIGRAHV